MPTRTSVRRSILAVDDYPDFLKLLAVLLDDYDVHEAATACTAIRMARKHPYDLYVLDYHMPEVGGIDLCRMIRAFDPNTPILVLSADSVEKQAREACANAYLSKCEDPGRLIDVVACLIAEQERSNDSARAAEEAAIEAYLKRRLAREVTECAAMRADVQRLGSQVSDSRQRLEDLRQLRAVAFWAYMEQGGGRAGFIAHWPELEPSI